MRVNRLIRGVGGRVAVVVVCGVVVAGCGGGGKSAKAASSSQATTQATTAPTSSKQGADPDVCSLITLDRFNAAVGTTYDKSNTSGIVTGGPTTDCTYSSSSGAGYSGVVNYLSDDNLGDDTDHYPKEQKLQKADAGGTDCASGPIKSSCYEDISGLGDKAFAHVGMSSDIEVEVVAHKGGATLTVGVTLPQSYGGSAGGDPAKAIAGLTQLAHLVFG